MSLRNGKSFHAPQTSNMTEEKPSTPLIRLARRPLITPYLLLVYPVLLGLGSAFSQISPIAAPADPAQQLNYFAGKRNLINVYFVKQGWGWTTLAFILLQLTMLPVPTRTQSQQKQRQNHYFHAFVRYTIATISWVLVTQWFFGPALIDRSFTLTGGHCESTTIPQNLSMNDDTTAKINRLPTLISAAACKASGGNWRGGHDISGHVFILALSSTFLIYELLISDAHSSHPSITPRAAANISHEMSKEEKDAVGGWETEQTAKMRIYARYFAYGVVSLDFWMLMMTAIWFHTWLEKLSGLMLAGATLYSIYFLGEFVEGWKEVVGF